MAIFKKSALEKGLEAILGSQGFLKERADTLCYGFDSSGYESEPSFVALPENREQVVEIVKLCGELGVPITPRGAASSTTGSAVPQKGGLVMSFAKMNRILAIDTVELTARVEPGVVTGRLQAEVEECGLFYPPDPASLNFCTIGGNVATGAGGARAVKYGVTKDYVRSLKVVLSDGTLLDTGAETAKGVVGYDLTRLFVGSEGTLGVVVEVLLRLLPRPEAVSTAAASFADVDKAVDCITCLFTSGLLPSCAEFLDDKTVKAVEARLPFSLPPDTGAFVLIEVDGMASSVTEEMERVKECFTTSQATQIYVARDQGERERLWQARRSVSPVLKGLGYEVKLSEDICVPRKNIKEMLLYLRWLEEFYPVAIYCFGHLGDGNIHVNLLFNHDDMDVETLHKLISAIMKKTVELGGTISGEHGVGLSKRDFLPLELSSEALELERGIKRLFDPKGIMNPGKIL
ncbi:MAG: FAD-binding protein [Thermodesulfobacteria bacterium]|nr:FAD-binding protein [Thermodesulfobacteriota bacterium]